MEHRIFDFTGTAFDIAELFLEQPYLVLLESSLFQAERGRYSIIGFDPFDVYSAREVQSLNELRKAIKKYSLINTTDLPLVCGAIGYVAYDYGLYQEKIHLKKKPRYPLDDLCFGFYDALIIIDHFEKKLHVTSTGLPEGEGGLQVKRSKDRMEMICQVLSKHSRHKRRVNISSNVKNDISFTKSMARQAYDSMIQRALEYITDGDIYQVNLSQIFLTSDCKASSFEVYRMLRNISPSSFGCYFDCGKGVVMSSTPERFLYSDGKRVETRPMKGTRPRGRNKREDETLIKDIIDSSKDKAELLMITDLLRNDLGRVCEYGSVHVKEMRELETYSTVFQTISAIEGMLRKDKDVFDLLEACFPGGSITGCPKIRAMQIIEELEPFRRGLYTGSMGYISFDGKLDMNILIRTIIFANDQFMYHVGGGIVADSTSENEYKEGLVKAKAMHQSLEHVLVKKKAIEK